MTKSLHDYYNSFLLSIGTPDWLIEIVVLITIAIIAYGLHLITKHLIVPAMLAFVRRTPQKWDEILFSPSVMAHIGHLFPAIATYFLMETIADPSYVLYRFFIKATVIFIIVKILSILNSLSATLIEISNSIKALKGKSLNGIHQVFQIILISIGLILIISILANKSPLSLLAGIGASAAILILVFKDTILGFVAGIELSANSMLHVGDWITVPKYGADGDVIEITINTVKVRNFDNTISMVPPYVLVSDSFQNWKGMVDSGARRVKRSVNIDLLRVGFCTEEMMNTWAQVPQLAVFMKSQVNTDPTKITNLTMLRRYLAHYLDQYENLDHKFLYMARYLAVTNEGVPLEIYFFTQKIEWKHYESVISEVMDHIFAITPLFGLQIYERAANNIQPQ